MDFIIEIKVANKKCKILNFRAIGKNREITHGYIADVIVKLHELRFFVVTEYLFKMNLNLNSISLGNKTMSRTG